MDRPGGTEPGRRAAAARPAPSLGVSAAPAARGPFGAALGRRGTWVRNPIDAFLAAEHRKHGLKPRPAADPATLIRRVCLDLTGLVPSPEMVRAFVADPSDRAYEALVDRLLASPQYGERWGRHWMDVWRYSDWDGFGAEVRESQPHIWRWRDWIVESLNRDLPYDRMIVAMLAADETDPRDADSLRATGFLVRNWYKFNRNVWLDDTVEHTAKAFLGITLNCAKCHDHKYDPIPQTDYYAFRAFFEPYAVRTDPLPGQPDTDKAGLVRVYDGEAGDADIRLRAGRRKAADQGQAAGTVGAQGPRASGQIWRRSAPRPLPAEAFYPGLNAFVREEAIAQGQRAIAGAEGGTLVQASVPWPTPATQCGGREGPARRRAGQEGPQGGRGRSGGRRGQDRGRHRPLCGAASADAAALGPRRRPARSQTRLASGRGGSAQGRVRRCTKPGTRPNSPASPRPHARHGRRRSSKAREAVAAARKVDERRRPGYPPLTPIYPTPAPAGGCALARWITHPDNPLTARMAINQIWMHHFDTPLVPSVFDFGRNGKPPAIPALLDWLAVRLQAEGWHMKPIHRLIVTSAPTAWNPPAAARTTRTSPATPPTLITGG